MKCINNSILLRMRVYKKKIIIIMEKMGEKVHILSAYNNHFIKFHEVLLDENLTKSKKKCRGVSERAGRRRSGSYE